MYKTGFFRAINELGKMAFGSLVCLQDQYIIIDMSLMLGDITNNNPDLASSYDLVKREFILKMHAYNPSHGSSICLVSGETIGQYAWRQDKTTSMIFTGDIIVHKNNHLNRGEVRFNTSRQCYDVMFEDGKLLPLHKLKTSNIEVIGNIHQNKELTNPATS